MRSLRFLMVPLLLAACTDGNPAAPDVDVSPQFAAADVGWTEGVFPDETDVWVSCLGEQLRGTGTFWYQLHTVANGNREHFNAKYSMLGYEMVGMTTGHTWLPTPSMLHGLVYSEVFVAPLGEPFQVYKVTDGRYYFVNQTTGETLSWPLKLHISRNAAGEVKVEFQLIPCRVK